MKIYKAYKFRIYSNNKQKKLISQTLESVRFIYNMMLYEKEKAYKDKIYENIKIDMENKIITMSKLNQIKIRGYRKIKEIVKENDLIITEKIQVKKLIEKKCPNT